jgi:hypothetical protein
MAMSLRMPAEHGAWGMLAVPFLSAAFIAGIPTRGAAVALVLAALAVVGVFLLRASLEADGWRALLDAPHLALAAATLAAGAALIFAFHVRALLWLLPPAALLYTVQRVLVNHHAEQRESSPRSEKRSLAGEMVGVGILSLAAPAAWIALRGRLEATAIELWALNVLFFLGGVLHVKYRVRALQAHRAFGDWRERLAFGAPVFLYHFLLAGALAAWTILASRPAGLLLAFLPGIVRASRLAFQLGERFSIRRLGWTEVAHSVVFALLLVLIFRLAD